MLTTVTITGADDSTPIQGLLDLSAEFPFVEWGILVSLKQEGADRFPTRQWSDLFAIKAAEVNAQVAMHVCGEWVRRIMTGTMDWNDFPEVRIAAERVQINTHAEQHIVTSAVIDWIAKRNNKEFIFQLDGVNDLVFEACVNRRLRVTGLFDRSHGAGVLPKMWPTPFFQEVARYGYAGGLGPMNVEAEVPKIRAARMKYDFWIDMEGRVMDDENSLDLSKVRKVLELCAPLVG